MRFGHDLKPQAAEVITRLHGVSNHYLLQIECEAVKFSTKTASQPYLKMHLAGTGLCPPEENFRPG